MVEARGLKPPPPLLPKEENRIIDKYTKAVFTIIAINLFVISEIGFKTFQPNGSKGCIYMRDKKNEAKMYEKTSQTIFWICMLPAMALAGFKWLVN